MLGCGNDSKNLAIASVVDFFAGIEDIFRLQRGRKIHVLVCRKWFKENRNQVSGDENQNGNT